MSLFTKIDILNKWKELNKVTGTTVVVAGQAAAVIWGVLSEVSSCLIAVNESFYDSIQTYEYEENGYTVKPYNGILVTPVTGRYISGMCGEVTKDEFVIVQEPECLIKQLEAEGTIAAEILVHELNQLLNQAA